MSGPGTELGRLIPEWLARQTKGCGCQNWQRKMDAWGVAGCQKNRQMIINRLVAQRKLLPKAFHLMPVAAIRLGAARLVDQAIKNAESLAE
jgi:hypothetical protein